MSKSEKIMVAAAGALAVVVLLVTLWWLLIGGPNEHRRQANEAKAGKAIAEGQTASGKDAVTTVTGNAGREAQTDAQTRVNHQSIRLAPGSDAVVDAGVDSAGRRAVCMRRSARASEACKQLLQPHP